MYHFLLFCLAINCASSQTGDLLSQNSFTDVKQIVQENLLSEMNNQFGWDHGGTAQAVIALSLANATFFRSGDLQSYLIVKQLQLELAEILLRWHKQPVSAGQLAFFVNALIATCQDPHRFFDINLVSRLRNMIVTSDYEQALISLTLCNSGHHLSKDTILHLNSFLKDTGGVHNGLDTQAMTVLAIACTKEHFQSTYKRSILSEPLMRFMSKQNKDGSFGNIYTTALVVQALIAVGDNAESWQFEEALDYIAHAYRGSDVHLNLLSHFLVLPVLHLKSLASIRNTDCSDNSSTATDLQDHFMEGVENDVWHISFKDDGNNPEISSNTSADLTAVTYSLKHHNQNSEDGNISISTVVFINDGETFLHVMEKASETDERYVFTAKNYSFGLLVESLAGINNSLEDKACWLLYQLDKPEEEPKILNKGVAEIKPKNGDHFLFWYRYL